MVMPAFQRFPAEAAIIGRLLAEYAELEIALLDCVSAAREDFDATLKAMFRVRGETARINVGDALGHQVYDRLGLRADFELAVSAMRYCLKIRNQYAHCNWDDDFGRRAGALMRFTKDKGCFRTGKLREQPVPPAQVSQPSLYLSY